MKLKYANVLFEGTFDKDMLDCYRITSGISGFFASRNVRMTDLNKMEITLKIDLAHELNEIQKYLGNCIYTIDIVEITYKNDVNFEIISGFTFYE